MRLIVLSLGLALLASCGAEDSRYGSANDSPRCEAFPGAGGCRAERPRPDDNWRVTGFAGY